MGACTAGCVIPSLTAFLSIPGCLGFLGPAAGVSMVVCAALQGRNGADHRGVAAAGSTTVVAVALLGAAGRARCGVAAGKVAANEGIDQLGACGWAAVWATGRARERWLAAHMRAAWRPPFLLVGL